MSSGAHSFEAENNMLCTCLMIDDKCYESHSDHAASTPLSSMPVDLLLRSGPSNPGLPPLFSFFSSFCIPPTIIPLTEAAARSSSAFALTALAASFLRDRFDFEAGFATTGLALFPPTHIGNRLLFPVSFTLISSFLISFFSIYACAFSRLNCVHDIFSIFRLGEQH